MRVLLQAYFGFVYYLFRGIPSKAYRGFWNYLTRDFISGKEFVEHVVPVRRRGWMLLPALLRASLRASTGKLREYSGKLAISDRISIGESLTYFHFCYLRAQQSGEILRIPDLRIAPNTDVIRFMFCEEERIEIRDLIHERMREQIRELGTELDEVGINLYVNGLVSKFFRKQKWPDLGVRYQCETDPNLDLLRREVPRLEKSYLDFLRGENFYLQIDRYCKMADAHSLPFHYPGVDSFDFISFKQSIGLEKKYVVLFLRPMANDLTAPRSIHHPEAYEPAVQSLAEKGYQVVLMGTSSGTRFPEVTRLDGVIDYPRSGFQSLTHDLHLVLHCEFMITCNSGPSSMSLLFKKPTLWLNTVNPAQGIMLSNHRFYPKNIIKRDGKNLIWSEWLESPALYAQHDWHYQEAGLQWRDLEPEQIMEAVSEFGSLVENPIVAWESRTPRQKFFSSKLRPYHLNMASGRAMPCDAFLKYIDCPKLIL